MLGPELRPRIIEDERTMTSRRRLVLIVDDSPEDREVVRRYLQKDREVEYHFIEASSGSVGLALCRSSDVDCLLLDYDLPDLDGVDFLSRLTELTEPAPFPVIMLTGRGNETVAFQALKRGAQDYLVKGSFTSEFLRKTVDEAIERVKIRRELESQRRELERLYDDARDADRRKDEFLAMLAHELRNPMAPILNAVHVLKLRASDSATVYRMREVIEQQLRHLCRLVDDLLDVSRITRGKIQLRNEVVDLVPIVTRAVDNARFQIDGRGQKLRLDISSGPFRLEADPTRIEQVLMNLLANASKYTDPGGSIALTVDREEGLVQIRVRDDGIGIAPEMLPHVFDLFAQADHSLDRSQGGLGIGLTLVRSLVQMHGGSVEARSAGLGQGSEFTVRLPASVGPLAAEPESADSETPPQGGPLRVLIVDDNVHAAESLAFVVRIWHHDARIAYTGPEALSLAGSYHPQIVLLDIGLPGMDGYAVARALRARAEFSGVPIIAMTGYSRDEDFQRSEAAGFDRHLVKPISFDLLETILAERSLEVASR
jgi:signal transduction histidine kinase